MICFWGCLTIYNSLMCYFPNSLFLLFVLLNGKFLNSLFGNFLKNVFSVSLICTTFAKILRKHPFRWVKIKKFLVEMNVVNTVKELKEQLSLFRSEGKSIGLVPTMGALHPGHASLVKRAVEENDVVVVSIFVNPTQFNDKNDLKNYPRTLNADCALLASIGDVIVFAPEVEEMYPTEDTRQFSFAPLDTVMEGAFRPGHFNGVAQIVSKLFYAVEPHRAYFGEKDFQQLAIIREMVRQLGLGLEIVGCPIVRESDGLAMSSRNTLLTSEERERSLIISRTLFESIEYAKENSLAATKAFVENVMETTPGFKLEYYQIVDGNTLQPLNEWSDSEYIVGCIALFCGKIRLIDNIKYKG